MEVFEGHLQENEKWFPYQRSYGELTQGRKRSFIRMKVMYGGCTMYSRREAVYDRLRWMDVMVTHKLDEWGRELV